MADYFTQQPPEVSSNMHESQLQEPAQPINRKLENTLLDNVAINFIFSKGMNLSNDLLDINRIYQIIEKIKQLARAQIDSGSNDIDYLQLVDFLKNKDLGFVDELQ